MSCSDCPNLTDNRCCHERPCEVTGDDAAIKREFERIENQGGSGD